jgi:hypothetical protein
MENRLIIKHNKKLNLYLIIFSIIFLLNAFLSLYTKFYMALFVIWIVSFVLGFFFGTEFFILRVSQIHFKYLYLIFLIVVAYTINITYVLINITPEFSIYLSLAIVKNLLFSMILFVFPILVVGSIRKIYFKD